MNEIWIVVEECHGAVSWWTDKQKAYDEARRIIIDGWEEDIPITKEDISDKEIDDNDYLVTLDEQTLNKSWLE